MANLIECFLRNYPEGMELSPRMTRIIRILFIKIAGIDSSLRPRYSIDSINYNQNEQ
jgi:hypothetical protein